MEQGEANFVPIAVPLFCLYVFRLKLKTLYFKTISGSSTNVSVEISFSVLKSKCFLKNNKPSA